MTYRALRRHIGRATASHDWLEGVTFVLGLGFFALAAACGWGIVTALSNLGDARTPSTMRATVGFLEVTRGFAVVLFAVFGLLALGVGWFLSGEALRRWFRGRSRG